MMWGVPVFNDGGEELYKTEYQDDTIRGYRWWRPVLDADGGPVLQSLHYKYIWEAFNLAQCLTTSGDLPKVPKHRGKAPHPDHQCGLYAQRPERPVREWMNLTRAAVAASGSILMSGRIIICEAGFKAEAAEIESPVVVEVDCKRNCGNPAEFVHVPSKPYQTFPAWCSEHAPTGSAGPAQGVEVSPWMRDLVDGLHAHYGLEFISPLLMEEI